MINRRSLLASSISGFAAFAMQNDRTRVFAEALRQKSRRCIIMWMAGGPSQLETFDPKPGTITGGPTRAIKTNVPGVSISENLPNVAQHASDLCFLRSLTSKEGNHERASYVNHTGFKPIAAFPRPELGSLFAHENPTGELPGFITLGSTGYGPAYLGDKFAPFAIENHEATIRLLNDLKSGKDRFRLLDELTSDFDQRFTSGPVKQRKAKLRSVESLLSTKLTEMLNTSAEPKPKLAAYGSGDFGQRLLIARRLLEGGVSCVEVQHGSWDTHQNNFGAVKTLCAQMDKPWATLIDDLKASGLWDETLLIWIGDFGRTPSINANSGRDHYPKISNAVLAGGGLPGGLVIGDTNSTGTEITDQPLSTADLFATILHQFDVAPDAEYQTTFGSPTEATDGGQVIPELKT